MTRSKLVDLKDAEIEKYLRQIMLDDIGLEGQRRLRATTVAVIGMGGLGSVIATQLTAMGVGKLKIVDRDIVDISNLHRQYLYDTQLVGYPKVEAAAIKLKRLNPDVKIVPYPASLNVINAKTILESVDVVIDGLDRIEPRYVLNEAAVDFCVPYVFGAGVSSFGSVSTIIPHETPCLKCFYSNLRDDDLPRCSIVGVHPSLLGIVASIEVSETVRLITGREPHLKGKLMFIDLHNFDFEVIPMIKNPKCTVCGSSRKRQTIEKNKVKITEDCSREGKFVYIVDPQWEKEKVNKKQIIENLCTQGFTIDMITKMAIVAKRDSINVTILRSGVAVIQGRLSQDEAKQIYLSLIPVDAHAFM